MHRTIQLEAMITKRVPKLENQQEKLLPASLGHVQDVTTKENHEKHLLWLNVQPTQQQQL